jgi:Fur family zinc uptake transcriptional regulator
MSGALDRADQLLRERGARFTKARRKVFEILLSDHKALGAYAIAERLSAAGLSSQPVVAYRALDFLESHGLIHRIEGKNAFIACDHGQEHDGGTIFFICTLCERVLEIDAEPETQGFRDKAEAVGFQISTTIMEAKGLCPTCRQSQQSN